MHIKSKAYSKLFHKRMACREQFLNAYIRNSVKMDSGLSEVGGKSTLQTVRMYLLCFNELNTFYN